MLREDRLEATHGQSKPGGSLMPPGSRAELPTITEPRGIAPAVAEIGSVGRDDAPVSRPGGALSRQNAPLSRDNAPILRQIALILRKIALICRDIALICRDNAPILRQGGAAGRQMIYQ